MKINSSNKITQIKNSRIKATQISNIQNQANTNSPSPIRLGRMPTWQKLATYWIGTICLVTGLIWFFLADIFELRPPDLKIWWISHGVTGLLSLVLIGAALPQHVTVTWRSQRNRWGGLFSSLVLVFLAVSAGSLYYGSGEYHDTIRLCHILGGGVLLVAFPFHIIRGRNASLNRAFLQQAQNKNL